MPQSNSQETAPQSSEIHCLKVSSKSSPASVAGAVAGMIKDGVPVEIQSVGAGAVNQAVKAIAISRGFLSPVGIDIVCIPSFGRHRDRWRVSHSDQIQRCSSLSPQGRSS